MGFVLLKDGCEHPIPQDLRAVFEQIVLAFVEGDYRLAGRDIGRVASIDDELSAFIAESVSAYGSSLAPLNPKVWERSIYAHDTGERWSVLVDLTTEDEEVSDLVLHADLILEPDLSIRVWSVHVP